MQDLKSMKMETLFNLMFKHEIKMLSFIFGPSPNVSQDLDILVKNFFDRMGTPEHLDNTQSSKMLASIEYNNQEWNSECINNRKITIEDIKQFIHSSIEQVNIPSYSNEISIMLSFGILLKLDKSYAYTSRTSSRINGECCNFMSSSGTKYTKDNFERWSSIIQSNNAKPQIDEDGNFI